MTAIVRMKHVRMAHLCSGGAREWFASYGLPWNEFVTNGLPVEMIEATGDPLGLTVAQIARKDSLDGR